MMHHEQTKLEQELNDLYREADLMARLGLIELEAAQLQEGRASKRRVQQFATQMIQPFVEQVGRQLAQAQSPERVRILVRSMIGACALGLQTMIVVADHLALCRRWLSAQSLLDQALSTASVAEFALRQYLPGCIAGELARLMLARLDVNLERLVADYMEAERYAKIARFWLFALDTLRPRLLAQLPAEDECQLRAELLLQLQERKQYLLNPLPALQREHFESEFEFTTAQWRRNNAAPAWSLRGEELSPSVHKLCEGLQFASTTKSVVVVASPVDEFRNQVLLPLIIFAALVLIPFVAAACSALLGLH
jgi:hypothetical protein